ncbi:MAG: hypothetical protein WD152_05965 [Nitriliruptoraceae bacterium]
MSDEVIASAPEGVVQSLSATLGLTIFLAYVVVATIAAATLMKLRDV